MNIIKKSLSIFLVSGVIFGASQAFAYSTLLSCSLYNLPIENIVIVTGPTGLRIVEKPYDQDWVSRSITMKEWESKNIELRVGGGRTGYVYKEGMNWFFVFKGPNNWLVHGNADCSESL